jgi:hypothetical protein
MQNRPILPLLALLLLASCSPRDFLTRRLAADLISASDQFKTTQEFVLQIGIVSSKNYPSPEYLVLQHHGWILAKPSACSPGLVPPPCWDVLLTPYGVEAVRSVLPEEQTGKSSLTIPVARRELVGVTGISALDNSADVEFTWKWAPENEVGDALYSRDLIYKSTVGFRKYDDGWRIVQSATHPGQTIDDALKSAEPTP